MTTVQNDFKIWMENKNIEKTTDIIGFINTANEIYNNYTQKNLGFFESYSTLKEIDLFDVFQDLKKELEDYSSSMNDNLKASVQLQFDIASAIYLFSLFLNDYDEQDNLEEFHISANKTGGLNKIYYGAPGTGKSFNANNDYPDYKRITFHPEYTYFDFIGGLRPTQDNNTGDISYEFVPGPFTEVLIDAIFDKDNSYGLIIEEINRANTAAVFGDIFQLLDRDDKGQSKYSITNKDLTDYIKKTKKVTINEIVLPSNFDIISTMNSADQGVFVLDSAFKRRWQFEYTPIDFTSPELQNVTLAGFNLKWVHFGEIINAYLSQHLKINEDKLIGQWFLTKVEMQDPKLVASKLLMYLWDDVARYDRNIVFGNINTFSELIKTFHYNGIECFHPNLADSLKEFWAAEDNYNDEQ